MSEFEEGDVIYIPSYNLIKTRIIRIFPDYYTCDHWSCQDGPSYFKGVESHFERQAIRNLIKYLEKEYL